MTIEEVDALLKRFGFRLYKKCHCNGTLQHKYEKQDYKFICVYMPKKFQYKFHTGNRLVAQKHQNNLENTLNGYCS